MPANGIGNWMYDHGLTGYFTYSFVAFILPLLYGSWRFTLYHFIMGPFMARMLTNNLNEAPAVWCLLSIGFLLIVIKTPVRKILFVKWSFWERFLQTEPRKRASGREPDRTFDEELDMPIEAGE